MKLFRFSMLILSITIGSSLFFSCKRSLRTFFHEGVSSELAVYRARHVYDVHYNLLFEIPEKTTDTVRGKVGIRFKPLKARHGLIVDFQPGEAYIRGIVVNGAPGDYTYMNGHIYINANGLVPRQENLVEIDFVSSDQALNRSEEFMYTLFVPDRASTAFPCFDQPDIKATFDLTLHIPAHWSAMSNGPLLSDDTHEETRTLNFALSKPISTYLFAFTAGVFDQISHTEEGRTLTIFHRETDQGTVERNISRIFEQHFHALQWLEVYTGIPYPYEKFDMAILPGFQYSGMEHPGSIWYRDTRLFLDEDPSITRQISKASLIAHETAHMWFGNLVTMKWFDDVWLKEVFAGFMADKVVEELFPEVNHSLQFMLHHYPRAMSIDRSQGAHPIKQNLENMKFAGTLYGPVIYNKAPIIFKQLEQIMHEENFRSAVREYLAVFSHSNADWDDLVSVFGKYSDHDLKSWSQAWVYGKGMPEINYTLNWQPETCAATLQVMQQNPEGAKLDYTQYLKGVVLADTIEFSFELFAGDADPISEVFSIQQDPSLVLLNAKGMGYGYFPLKEKDIHFAVENIHRIEDENIRAALVLNMYENFLHGNINYTLFFEFVLDAIGYEPNQQILNYLLGNLDVLCRNFAGYNENLLLSSKLEYVLWDRMQRQDGIPVDVFLSSWMMHARSEESIGRMIDVYKGDWNPDGFVLSEQNRTALALELSLRMPSDQSILATELEKIENPDRKKRLSFIMPAASADKTQRDTFFNRLLNAENRNPEPWVLDALYYLHHPLHDGQGMEYIPQSLALLEEIQRTGDIFFPQNWLGATLQHYHQQEVLQMVTEYLENNPALSNNLRQKVYQASDLLFRAAEKY